MRALALLVALSTAALAQQAGEPPVMTAPPATPLDQALQERLLNELWVSVQCRQQAIALSTALQQAQAQIAELSKQVAELKKEKDR